MTVEITRRPFPLGKLSMPYATICQAVDRPPLVMPNCYPGQVIGICFRLPAFVAGSHGHPYLSIVWARPSKWWKS